MTKYICIVILACFSWSINAQETNTETESKHVVQLSGLVLAELDGERVAVPYVTVSLPNKKRGTFADHRGFFSIVVEAGDKVKFNYLGLETAYFIVPDTLTQDQYSVVQLMTEDTLTLPTTIIFPRPSREHFKIEFLKMDVTPELQRIATENLANEYLAEARKNPDIVPYGGKESANFYLRKQSRDYVYIGQTPPMNIFSPLAWGQFFKDWKDGKFKKKKTE